MQITKAEVIPVELKTKQTILLANLPPIQSVTAVFVRLETRQGQTAWGCTVAHPSFGSEYAQTIVQVCQECAAKVIDLHPLNLAYTLAELTPLSLPAPSALCAFDLALHDLLGIASGLPLYRLLGGYRNSIETSITIPLSPVTETVEMALDYAKQGFRIFKIKGGVEPEEDIQRVQALRQVLPYAMLRLDADGGYSVEEALDVARVLKDSIEFLEQPTPANHPDALREVTKLSPVPIIADQSACGIDSTLDIATHHTAHGISIKVASCGGIQNAIQMDTIARAAHLKTMVSCLIEPALLIAAGLSVALASPNVHYGDL
ncbi:MAG: mandelate racemase/muconate lactonizing enzyme family protein, partial [Anaerolineales bacterium]